MCDVHVPWSSHTHSENQSLCMHAPNQPFSRPPPARGFSQLSFSAHTVRRRLIMRYAFDRWRTRTEPTVHGS